MQHALDYRHNYAAPAPNPLSGGQMVMIGAAAIAVSGLSYWGWQAMKKKKQDAAAAPANGAEGNPGLRSHHYYPRAA